MFDPQSPSTDSHRLDVLQRYSESAHSYIRALPGALDVKASFLLSAVTGIMLYEINALGGHFSLSLPTTVSAFEGALPYYGMAATYILSMTFGLFALNAQTDGDTQYLFSFVAFARRKTSQEAVNEINGYANERLIEATLRHCHELSQLCARKAARFRWAFRFSLMMLFCFAYLQVKPLLGL